MFSVYKFKKRYVIMVNKFAKDNMRIVTFSFICNLLGVEGVGIAIKHEVEECNGSINNGIFMFNALEHAEKFMEILQSYTVMKTIVGQHGN